MMLVELTPVPSAALPVAEFKDHLRLGTGFADDGVQDSVLETCLRAAIASVEARTGKATLTRSYQWSLTAWRDLSRQALPVAPVETVTQFSIVDRAGQISIVDPAGYHLERDMHRPAVVADTFYLPTIPIGGTAEFQFDAGFGATWAELPADIARAVFLLAAHYYEHRHETSATEAEMPFGVATLIERYRNIRLFGGGL